LVVTASVLLSVVIFIIDFSIGINKEGFWKGVIGWIYENL